MRTSRNLSTACKVGQVSGSAEDTRWPHPGSVAASGFTLLELLVVVVITITLGGLLLVPALARTNPSVKAWQCINNLKQWSQAMRLYAGDNLDLIPRDGFDHTGLWPGSDGGHADSKAWFNLLPQFLAERSLNDYWNDAGIPMERLPFPGGKGKLWHCPSASMSAADVASISGGGAEGFFSVDMNSELKKQTADVNFAYPLTSKLTSFVKPSATVVFFECAFNPRTEVVNGSPQYNSVNPANRGAVSWGGTTRVAPSAFSTVRLRFAAPSPSPTVRAPTNRASQILSGTHRTGPCTHRL